MKKISKTHEKGFKPGLTHNFNHGIVNARRGRKTEGSFKSAMYIPHKIFDRISVKNTVEFPDGS